MEALRLSALRQYRILDTEPERRIDDLALLASHVCGTPMALITLVDEHRQWFKSRVGVSAAETSRAVSFCAHAIEQQDLFIISDTLQDERFRENPLVTGDPHIRFYAGAPLVTPDGHALGTLCVIDNRSRTLTADQRAALDALRRQVESQLELRRNLIELDEALAARNRAEAEQAATMGELRAAHENLRRLSALDALLLDVPIHDDDPSRSRRDSHRDRWRRRGAGGEHTGRRRTFWRSSSRFRKPSPTPSAMGAAVTSANTCNAR